MESLEDKNLPHFNPWRLIYLDTLVLQQLQILGFVKSWTIKLLKNPNFLMLGVRIVQNHNTVFNEIAFGIFSTIAFPQFTCPKSMVEKNLKSLIIKINFES